MELTLTLEGMLTQPAQFVVAQASTIKESNARRVSVPSAMEEG